MGQRGRRAVYESRENRLGELCIWVVEKSQTPGT